MLCHHIIYRTSSANTDQAVLPEPSAPAECLSESEESQQNKLLTAMGYDPVHPDWLAEQLQLPAVDIYKELLEHEMAGNVAAVAGGRYQRIKPPSRV